MKHRSFVVAFTASFLILFAFGGCQSQPAKVEEAPKQVLETPHSVGPTSPPSVKGPTSPPPTHVDTPQAVTESTTVQYTLPKSNESEFKY